MQTLFDESFTPVTPTTEALPARWMFPPLYREESNGNLGMWQIGFDGQRVVTRNAKLLRRESGYVLNDVQEPHYRDVVLNSSGRGLNEQAFVYARGRKYLKKLRETHRPPGCDLRQAKRKEAMLAVIYLDGSDTSRRKNPTKRQLAQGITQGDVVRTKLDAPVSAQVKIDGIRMLCSLVASQGTPGGSDVSVASGMRVYCRSRKDLEFKFLQHLKSELILFLAYLPTGEEGEVDGELFNPQLNIQQITERAAVNAVSPLPGEEELSYYIYDITLPCCYRERNALLKRALQSYREDNPGASRLQVLDHTVVADPAVLTQFRDFYESQGYEGLIVRKLDTAYRYGRSVAMLKYKSFMDKEGPIHDLHEQPGKPGFLEFYVAHASDSHPGQHYLFKVCMNGNDDYNRKLFARRDTLRGKLLNYKYKGETLDGKPYIPRGRYIREEGV